MPVLKNLQTLTWDDPGLVQNGVLAQHLTSETVSIQESTHKYLSLCNAGFSAVYADNWYWNPFGQQMNL